MNLFVRAFLAWLPLGLAITIGCIGGYAALQQSYRQNANDPQIQMAEDAAAQITSGKQIDQVVPVSTVDIGTSLSPWLEIYNNAGVPLLSSGKLNGEVPQIPVSALQSAAWSGAKDTSEPNENRITWEPRSDVRQAIVIVSFSSQNGAGYVVAGRSLREVEERVGRLGSIVLLGWLLSVIGTIALQFFAMYVVQSTERR